MIKAQIQDKELSEYLDALPKDEMIYFTMADGRVRGALFAGTHFVNQMRVQHNTGILETHILGQASLSAALLIPALMKGREHATIRYDVPNAPAKGFCVEADSAGWVRGYLFVDNVPVEKPLENWDLKPFLGGEGFMSVQIVHPNDKYPQTSSVNTTGNIADDFVFYFDRSAQLKTALKTSIQMDKSARVIGAGGIFVQVMPKTGGQYNGIKKAGSQIDTSSNQEEDDALIEQIEKAFANTPSLGKWYSQGRTSETLLKELFKDFNPIVALSRDILFECPCSKDSYIKYIKNLPANELKDIKQNGPNPLEIVCRNCSSVYHIDVNELN